MPAMGGYLLMLLLILGLGGCSHPMLSRAEMEQKFMAQIKESEPAVDRVLTRAKYHRLAGRLDLAKEVLTSALQQQANNVRLLNALGNLEDDLGNYAQAQERYRQILTLEPDNVLARNNLGYSYYLAGDLQQAETILREVMANHPENTVARNNLGLVLCRQERQAEALTLWEKYDGPGAAQEKLQAVLTLLGNSTSRNQMNAASLPHQRHAQALQPSPPLSAPAETWEATRSATPPREVAKASVLGEGKSRIVSSPELATSLKPEAGRAPSVTVEEVPMVVQPAAAPLESRSSVPSIPEVTPPPRAEFRSKPFSPPEIEASDLEEEDAPPVRSPSSQGKRQRKFRMLIITPEEASSHSTVRHYLQQFQIHQAPGGTAKQTDLVF